MHDIKLLLDEGEDMRKKLLDFIPSSKEALQEERSCTIAGFEMDNKGLNLAVKTKDAFEVVLKVLEME